MIRRCFFEESEKVGGRVRVFLKSTHVSSPSVPAHILIKTDERSTEFEMLLFLLKN